MDDDPEGLIYTAQQSLDVVWEHMQEGQHDEALTQLEEVEAKLAAVKSIINQKQGSK